MRRVAKNTTSPTAKDDSPNEMKKARPKGGGSGGGPVTAFSQPAGVEMAMAIQCRLR